ncbi:MAG: symmetrical bis(5'-nucleosyl)-tetraphosphatase [Hydrogenophilus sp.]|nr:symmetrical bis(5'-nucleosyl)-tetraphosphatase [Hydrogenophilus sp.]
MATYAIGDVQGCWQALRRLLEVIAFSPERDRLWLVGDLVNRGPQSLEVVRFLAGLPEQSVAVVLGNHDLYCLMRAWGGVGRGDDDTLDALLAAPDRDRLLAWLRSRPLLVWDDRLGYAMAHAGVPPVWSWAGAVAAAAEVEALLRGDSAGWLAKLKGGEGKWRDDLEGMARVRYIVNGFTRMRFVDERTGDLELKEKGPPYDAPRKVVPWFRFRRRIPLPYRVVFGHWSLLGFYCDRQVLAVDTSCVYGGRLTAVRLEDGRVYSVSCPVAVATEE